MLGSGGDPAELLCQGLRPDSGQLRGLDGHVERPEGKAAHLYAPGLDRHDFGFPMGPILGVVVSGD